MVRTGGLLLIISACSLLAALSATANCATLNGAFFELRGGLVPQADETGGDYYEQFELDYGTKDNKRVAGATRGFIRSGKLAGLPESDPFKKWLNQHLEKGSEPISGRVKPFYVSFGGDVRHRSLSITMYGTYEEIYRIDPIPNI